MRWHLVEVNATVDLYNCGHQVLHQPRQVHAIVADKLRDDDAHIELDLDLVLFPDIAPYRMDGYGEDGQLVGTKDDDSHHLRDLEVSGH